MSEPTRHDVKDILDHALELGGAERAELLDTECGDDSELRAEIEGLIRALESRDGFLETPPLELDVADIARWAEPEAIFVGRQVGRYTLDRVIASGGMGTVYEAHIEGSGEAYAVKLVKAGLVSEAALRRFEHEAALLSLLDHECIARMHDVGSFDTGLGEVPFFAMEYVRGAMPVTEYAAAKKLDVRARLDLFLRICSAIEHGHRKGIIHRDLKPGNILVDAGGQLKVIDFGVARATEVDVTLASQHTAHGQLVGTLQYMSPEQCAGDSRDIDTCSDVYSLGVVLFELLTGSLPYDLRGVPLSDAMQIVREHPSTRPSLHDQTLSGDLETIVLKALEKERDRRYGSVAEFGGDVERYLNNEPIRARPPSAVYLMRKFAKRNRGLVAGMSLAVLALVTGTVVAITFAVGEAQARKGEALQRQESDRKSLELLFVNELLNDVVLAMSPDGGTGESRTETTRRVLETWATRLESEFTDTPLVRASLHHTIAERYEDPLGMYSAAHEHLKHAWELRKEHLGPHHRDTVTSMMQMGWVLSRDRQWRAAERLLREALNITQQHFEPDDQVAVQSRGYLIHVLTKDEKFDEAIELARSNLEFLRSHFGEDHLDTTSAKASLARALVGGGKFEEVIRLEREVLAWNQDHLGRDHIKSIQAMLNLADSLHGLHRRDRKQGAEEEEELLLREAIEIANGTVGMDHPIAHKLRRGLSEALLAQGRMGEAVGVNRELLDAQRSWYGGNHAEVAFTLHHLGDMLGQQGEFDDGEALIKEAIAYYEQHPSEQTVEYLHALSVLAYVYEDQGRFGEMGSTLHRQLEQAPAYGGAEEDRWAALARFRLGMMYYNAGQFVEGEAYSRPAAEWFDNNGAFYDDYAVTARNNLAASLLEQGKVEEAAAEYREVCRRAPNTFAANDPRPWLYQAGLGHCLLHLEEFIEAEKLLLQAEERLAATTSVDHPWTRGTRTRLVKLYEAWDKPEQAEQWRARLAAGGGES